MTTEEALAKVIEVGKELTAILDQLKNTDDKLVGLFEQYAKTALVKPSEQARIAEYNSLSSFINSRNTSHMTLNGFLVTGGAVALTFAVSTSSTAGVGGWVALFPGLLIALAWTNLVGVNYVDRVTFNHIKAIEKELGMSGHASIYDEIHSNPWYKLREKIWHVFYLALLVASLITAVYLFSKSV